MPKYGRSREKSKVQYKFPPLWSIFRILVNFPNFDQFPEFHNFPICLPSPSTTPPTLISIALYTLPTTITSIP